MDYNAFDDQETSADIGLENTLTVADANADSGVTENLLDFDTMGEEQGETVDAVGPVLEQEAEVEPEAEAEAEEAEAQMSANVSMRGRSSSKANKKVSMLRNLPQ